MDKVGGWVVLYLGDGFEVQVLLVDPLFGEGDGRNEELDAAGSRLWVGGWVGGWAE